MGFWIIMRISILKKTIFKPSRHNKIKNMSPFKSIIFSLIICVNIYINGKTNNTQSTYNDKIKSLVKSIKDQLNTALLQISCLQLKVRLGIYRTYNFWYLYSFLLKC